VIGKIDTSLLLELARGACNRHRSQVYRGRAGGPGIDLSPTIPAIMRRQSPVVVSHKGAAERGGQELSIGLGKRHRAQG
jgi:hypothetical protein